MQNLIGDTAYQFRVQAINSVGPGPQGLSSDLARTLQVPPFSPGKPLITHVQQYQLLLSWDEPSKDGGFDIAGYRVWQQEGSNDTWAIVSMDTTTNDTSLLVSGLQGNTMYAYKVAGINALGLGNESASSDEAKTPPVPPDSPSAVTITGVSLNCLRTIFRTFLTILCSKCSEPWQPGSTHLVYTWFLVPGSWHLVTGALCQATGSRCQVFRYQVSGSWAPGTLIRCLDRCQVLVRGAGTSYDTGAPGYGVWFWGMGV